MKTPVNAVVMGVSAGGFKALHRILPILYADFPLPIMVVQHRKPDEEAYFIQSLENKCLLHVQEVIDKMKILPGNIYIAPGGYHLLVEKDLTLSLSVDPPVCHCRPSIDVLFESAAEAFASRLVGIIMTGANSDGSNGIKVIKSLGGITIAQNPETADINYMPLSAIKTGAVDHILHLDEITQFLIGLLENRNE